jgi:DNA-binding transcriptional regulator YiaG
MTEQQENLDAATERMVRDLLRGRDGEIRIRFRVEGDRVSMQEVDPETAPAATSADPGHVTFADWMSGLIRSRKMSQEAMARLLGVSLKTVNRWVNGRTEPRMRELRRIQQAFGVAPPL